MRRTYLIFLVVLGLALAVAAPAYATFGDMDPGFGSGGLASIQVGTCAGAQQEGVFATALEPGGDIAFAGAACDGAGGSEWVVGRLLPNGAPDPAFAGSGYATAALAPSGSLAEPNAVAIEPDGDICGGGFANLANGGNAAVACYTSRGTPDTTFGSNGVVFTPVTGDYGVVTHLLYQPSSGELVAGVLTASHGYELMRYTASGALDSSFGSGGVASTGISPASSADHGINLALAPDGGLIVAGDSSADASHTLTVSKLTANGQLDTSFGSGGSYRTAVGPNDSVARALLVQSDGGIVYAGLSSATGYAMGRLTATGQPDASFGSGGVVLHDEAPGNGTPGYLSLMEQSDGKLVVTSHTQLSDGSFDFSLVRYLADGSPDTSYGDGDGKVIAFETNLPSRTDGANNGSLYQPDGKIVTGGYLMNSANDSELAFNRFQDYRLNNGLPAPSSNPPPNTSPSDPTCSKPSISSVSPAHGVVGDRITVSGSGFGASTDSADSVRFGSAEGQVMSWSSTRITVLVPERAGSPISVTCGSTEYPISSINTPGAHAPGFTVLAPPKTPPVAQGVCVAAGAERARLTSFSLDSNAGGRIRLTTWQMQERVKVRVKLPSKHDRVRYRTVMRTKWVTISTSSTALQRFPRPGSYRLRLRVVDAYRLSASTSVQCKVARKVHRTTPPPVSLIAPSDVLFDFASAHLSPAGESYLRRVVQPLLTHAKTLKLVGGCSWEGSTGYNYQLGLARANAVRAALRVPRGMGVQVVSVGKADPIASNLTAAGRSRNRRVEIHVGY